MPKFKHQKKADPAWHPRQDAKRKKSQPTEAGSQVERLLKLMQSDSTPAKRMAVVSSRTSPLNLESAVLTPSQLLFSTPTQGPRTRKVTTPNGTALFPARILTFNDGETTLFLPANKVSDNALNLPQPNTWLENSPVPQVDQSGLIDAVITLEMIKNVDKLKRERERMGQNPRGQSQNKLMRIPATRALKLAGIAVEDGIGQWLHFGPHSFFGDEAQKATNIGLGTRYANAAMELVNPVIKSLLLKHKENLPQLYLSAIPEWAEGFERIRLLKSINCVLKDGPGQNFTRSASIKFNTLSLNPVCLSEIEPVRQAIMNKFSHAKPATLPSKKRESDAESPSLKRIKARR
jgi:hypothetical protein